MRYLKTLKKLFDEKEINFSSIPKKLRDELLDEGLIEIKVISANKRRVIITKEFSQVYNNLDEIDIANTRAALIEAKSDSKVKKISPQDGLYINGKCLILDFELPISQNSAVFLKDIPNVDKDILIVCVENFENIIYVKEQFKYFRDINILFVYRNATMLNFIKDLENEIIYFGDFDLAGIDIYLTQIKPKNKNISFFIPTNIQELIVEFGSKKLYEKQINKYKTLTTNEKNIQVLIDIINKEQKALEQEYFING